MTTINQVSDFIRTVKDIEAASTGMQLCVWNATAIRSLAAVTAGAGLTATVQILEVVLSSKVSDCYIKLSGEQGCRLMLGGVLTPQEAMERIFAGDEYILCNIECVEAWMA